ncbi:MAG TPA: GlsB/YeaQ/YmgE family stress response membrane protein [Candidatus Sulfotelmatobacter sp.]|nr:GlsB/YeaQ/YmgE family stress response membrane protein [Candidatus Sulfotelmatobacter sp.]
MSIIAWIVLGLIAGFIASKIVNKAGEGFIFAQFGAAGVTGFNLYSMFVAVVGAIVVLIVYHAIVRR